MCDSKSFMMSPAHTKQSNLYGGSLSPPQHLFYKTSIEDASSRTFHRNQPSPNLEKGKADKMQRLNLHFGQPNNFDDLADSFRQQHTGHYNLNWQSFSAINSPRIEAAKSLTMTDMILLQKEIEKLAQTAFKNIKKDRLGQSDQNDIVLNWCMSSIHLLLQVMPTSAIETLTKQLGGKQPKNVDTEMPAENAMHESIYSFEIFRRQKEISMIIDRVRTIVIEKASESDQVIEECSHDLHDHRVKFSAIIEEENELDTTIQSTYDEMNNINTRTTRLLDQLKQLASDHHAWLDQHQFTAFPFQLKNENMRITEASSESQSLQEPQEQHELEIQEQNRLIQIISVSGSGDEIEKVHDKDENDRNCLKIVNKRRHHCDEDKENGEGGAD